MYSMNELKRLQAELKALNKRQASGFGDSVNDNLRRRELAFKILKLKQELFGKGS